MGTKLGDVCQEVTNQPGMRSEETDEGWTPSNPSKLKLIFRQQLVELTLLHPGHRVLVLQGIVDRIVIPQGMPVPSSFEASRRLSGMNS
jgi:hypothetical protein